VTVYVVDSGIRLGHAEFGGRARSGHDFVDDDADASDCNGHGTVVAGIAGGSTWGAAKGVKLVSVRVFGCENSGPFTDIIAGFDWVLAHRSGPSVVNFSGGGGPFEPMDQAVSRTVAAGIPVVVAAMNDGHDACAVSPARAPAAITVGATERTDARAGYSNYGSCVDLFAPGSGIPSSAAGSDTAGTVATGTSMAAPHVAGVIARYLQAHPGASPAVVGPALAATATKGVVTDARSAHADLVLAGPPAARVSRPGAPAGVSGAQVRTTRTANLHWQPPASDGGSPVTGYRVQRAGKDTAGRTSWGATLPATARSVTFGNLRYRTGYTLSVRAVNAAGTGPARTVKVTPIQLPGAPKIGRASSGKAGGTITAKVRWSGPGSDGGSALTGYRITALRLDDQGRTVAGTSHLVGAKARSVELKLPAAGRYQFFVQAANRAGAGPQSARSNQVSGR
jgi:subtilisin family serine protease